MTKKQILLKGAIIIGEVILACLVFSTAYTLFQRAMPAVTAANPITTLILLNLIPGIIASFKKNSWRSYILTLGLILGFVSGGVSLNNPNPYINQATYGWIVLFVWSLQGGIPMWTGARSWLPRRAARAVVLKEADSIPPRYVDLDPDNRNGRWWEVMLTDNDWRWWALVMLSISVMGVWLAANGMKAQQSTGSEPSRAVSQTPEAPPSAPEAEATSEESPGRARADYNCIEAAHFAGFILQERNKGIDRKIVIAWAYDEARHKQPRPLGFATLEQVVRTVNELYRNELNLTPAQQDGIYLDYCRDVEKLADGR